MAEKNWQDNQSETASDKKPEPMSKDTDQKPQTESSENRENKTDQSTGQ